MKPAINRQTTLHIWVLGTIAVLLSCASAFSYFLRVGQGIVIGDLLGLPGREADVALAQHRYTYLANCVSDLFDRLDSDDGSCTSVLRGSVTSGAVHRTFYYRLDLLRSVDSPDRCGVVHNHHGTTSFGSPLTGEQLSINPDITYRGPLRSAPTSYSE